MSTVEKKKTLLHSCIIWDWNTPSVPFLLGPDRFIRRSVLALFQHNRNRSLDNIIYSSTNLSSIANTMWVMENDVISQLHGALQMQFASFLRRWYGCPSSLMTINTWTLPRILVALNEILYVASKHFQCSLQVMCWSTVQCSPMSCTCPVCFCAARSTG